MRTIALLIAVPVFAQTPLPDAPGKEVVVRVCTGCHGTSQLTRVKRDREHWQRTVERMAGMGATASPADFKTVVDYLAANLGADAAPALETVNVNRAAGWRIARALQLTPAEGDAIAAYREDHGDFKTLDDLAKIVDRARLEAAKDRIVF